MNKKATLFFLLGTVMIASAILLAGYNLYLSYHAGKKAGEITDLLLSEITLSDKSPASTDDPPDKGAPSTDKTQEITSDDTEELPVRRVDGNDYIAVIKIPALELELPVMAEFSYQGLKTSPCLYGGSLSGNDLIIAGHNYTSHFGRLDRLRQDDLVYLYDVLVNEYRFCVTETEILSENSADELISGNNGLTLFTCTVGGGQRIVIRCEKSK